MDKIKYLADIGLNTLLLDNLTEQQLQELTEYALDHHASATLCQDLVRIASLELKGKAGAIFLIKNDLATIAQAKNLEAEQIKAIIEFVEESDTTLNDTLYATKKLVRDYIIYNQQCTIASKTGEQQPEFTSIHNHL